MNIIIAGIHTGIGKTLCSAVICHSLGYDYWKPVQAGNLDDSDSLFVRNSVDNSSTVVHPERHILRLPASPHYAAACEGITIQRHDFVVPRSERPVVVETAGGLMSPLAADLLNIDLIEYLNIPVVLVSNSYLGSINHTLLSAELLKSRGISVRGIVFSGEKVSSSEDFILNHTGLPHLFSIPHIESCTPLSVRNAADGIRIKL
jgi:dethiobiotin synthetase